MKKLILLLVLYFSMPAVSQSPDFNHIATINIDPWELGQKYEFASTEFLLSNRTSIGKHYAFNLSDIIDPYLKDLSVSKRSNVIIIAKDNSGNTLPFSYTEVSDEYSMMPALLTFTKKMVGMPDTLIVSDNPEGPSGLEINQVEEFFNVLTKRRIYLQLKFISADQKKQIFNTTTVIFPIDKTTNRWLTDLKEFDIYYYGELELDQN